MRTSLLALAALVAIGSATPGAAAPSYPWCARYATSGGECSFTTYDQCMATLSGIGGVCVDNPGYTGQPTAGPFNAVPRAVRQHLRRY